MFPNASFSLCLGFRQLYTYFMRWCGDSGRFLLPGLPQKHSSAMARIVGGEPNWEGRQAIDQTMRMMSCCFRRDPPESLQGSSGLVLDLYRSQIAGPNLNYLLDAAGPRWPDLVPGDSSDKSNNKKHATDGGHSPEKKTWVPCQSTHLNM